MRLIHCYIVSYGLGGQMTPLEVWLLHTLKTRGLLNKRFESRDELVREIKKIVRERFLPFSDDVIAAWLTNRFLKKMQEKRILKIEESASCKLVLTREPGEEMLRKIEELYEEAQRRVLSDILLNLIDSFSLR